MLDTYLVTEQNTPPPQKKIWLLGLSLLKKSHVVTFSHSIMQIRHDWSALLSLPSLLPFGHDTWTEVSWVSFYLRIPSFFLIQSSGALALLSLATPLPGCGCSSEQQQQWRLAACTQHLLLPSSSHQSHTKPFMANADCNWIASACHCHPSWASWNF